MLLVNLFMNDTILDFFGFVLHFFMILVFKQSLDYELLDFVMSQVQPHQYHLYTTTYLHRFALITKSTVLGLIIQILQCSILFDLSFWNLIVSLVCSFEMIFPLWNADIAKMMKVMLISLSSKLVILFRDLLSKFMELNTRAIIILKILVD